MSDDSGEPRAFVETFSFVVAGEKATVVKYNAYAKIKVENERLTAETDRQQEKLIAIARDRDRLRQLLSEAREVLRCNAVNPKRIDIMEQSSKALANLERVVGK